jgi:hypothetical protein
MRMRGWRVVTVKKTHVGLKARLIHSIKCDEGREYERYFSVSFLPPKNGLEPCVTAGCLEVSKSGGGKEFYNPSKFYEPETLEQAVASLIALLAAFRAYKYGREPYQAFHQTMNRLLELRPKIAELTQAYFSTMKMIEAGEA